MSERTNLSRAVLEGVADGTTDLIAALDFNYRVLFRNKAYADEYERLWGHRIAEGEHLLDPMNAWPEEREKARAIWDRALTGERFNITQKFGPDAETSTYYDLRFSPVRNAAGDLIGAAHIFRDVTEERRRAALQETLVEELQHRTRNLLTVIQSVARRTKATSTDLDDFDARFMSRLHALGRATGLLSRTDAGRSVTFDALLAAELEAHGFVAAEDQNRIQLVGPAGVMLASSRLQAFALVLHELMTNALKHGALRDDDGRLRITWRVEPVEERAHLVVEWTERWETPRPAAGTGGFGRELIESALPEQLGGRTRFQLDADGLTCIVSAPVSRRYTR